MVFHFPVDGTCSGSGSGGSGLLGIDLGSLLGEVGGLVNNLL